MAYAVCVTWIAKDGEEEAVAAALGRLLEPSRAEPGVQLYVPHRDPNDPRVFFMYEQYSDEAAYQAHVNGRASGVTAVERDGAVHFSGITGSHTFAWGTH